MPLPGMKPLQSCDLHALFPVILYSFPAIVNYNRACRLPDYSKRICILHFSSKLSEIPLHKATDAVRRKTAKNDCSNAEVIIANEPGRVYDQFIKISTIYGSMLFETGGNYHNEKNPEILTVKCHKIHRRRRRGGSLPEV